MLSIITLMDNKEHKKFMEDIYNKHYQYMLGCAYNRVSDIGLAEEIVQDAFVSLISNIEKIIALDCNKIKRYIVVTIINKCNNFYRRKKNREISTEDAAELLDNLKKLNFTDEDFFYVKEAVKNLKPEYRQVIVYRYYYDYDYKSIATHMSITVSHTGVLLSRALQSLKKELVKRRDNNER